MAEAQILIVEDEIMIARDIETRLRELGYAVPTIASSGEDAIARAAETRPDLVLMDVQLTGEMGGVTAAEEIQARFDIPVIYLTTCADDETLERAKISGPLDYILKPVEATELLSAVEMALYKHRLEKRLRESETLLTAINDQISVAIGNAWLYQEAQQRTGELAALNRAGQVITSSLALDTVLPQVIAEARAMLNVEAVSILLHDTDSDELMFAAAASPASEVLVGTRMPATAGIAGWTLQNGRPVLVRDTQTDPRFYDRIDNLTRIDTRTLIAMPLRYKGTTIGVIEAINKVDGPFDEHDLDLALALANSAAIAIENARLYEAEREQRWLAEQSQAHLVHTEKMAALGRLAASIAHEINNPLQAVLGCMRLAEEELQGRCRVEKLERHLGVAMAETRRISAILQRMRDFYRRSREELEPTDVHAVLESVLALSAKQLQHSNVTVERDWVDDLPIIRGNADHLRQVFLNLLINAIDAMPQGGTLRICTAFEEGIEGSGISEEGRFLCIAFSDTGVGMSPDVQDRLFEPFFTTKKEGTGLGLSISYGIIESHNGQMMVASQEGEGTTVTILLPAA
jgi:signal transduction histidine kinase/CheY-like chemotaxis protein